MTDADRIRLAKAMGWTLVKGESPIWCWHCGDESCKKFHFCPPDPFTSANDDYAVLEWARTNPEGFGVCYKGKWMGFTTFMHMNEQEAHQYHIGDYARAALKVIE